VNAYRIARIPEDARLDTEQLGSKPKFWVFFEGHRWLFKEARINTGEDWAEKVAAEIAKAIGIRAATVELAQYAGRRGSISLNFVDVDAGGALVHGNEILALQVTGYDKGKMFQQSDHTLENIRIAIQGLFGQVADPILTELAGYLVLDALIGNTDRHHENWGLVVQVQRGDDVNHKIGRLQNREDRDASALKVAGYLYQYIPVLALPDPDGRNHGRMITGSIKGPSAVQENLVPRLQALLSGKPVD